MPWARFALAAAALLVAPPAGACPRCRVAVREAALAPDLAATAALLLLPLLVIAALAVALYVAAPARHRAPHA